MNDFLNQQLPAIITGLLGLSAWVYEKRKKTAEIQQAEGDAIASMQGAYKNFVADHRLQYAELKTQYTEVMQRIAELQIETGKLQGEVNTLRKEVDHWKNKYTSLKKEVDNNNKKV